MKATRSSSRSHANSLARRLPKVAIVILHWHGLEDTLACLDSLDALSYSNWQLVLVLNGSSETDDTALSARVRPSTRVMRLPKNSGFARGSNIGASVALAEVQPDFILLLNNDVLVDSELLTALVTRAAAEPDAAIVGAKTYLMDSNRLQFTVGDIDMWRGRAINRGSGQLDTGRFGQARETCFVQGSCLLIRASVVQHFGLFDESFFAYWEETDLCARLRERGFRILYEPGAMLWHRDSSSTASPQKLYYLLRNNIYFMRKHGHSYHWCTFLPYLILRTTPGLSFRPLLTHPWLTVQAVVRAYWDGFHMHGEPRESDPDPSDLGPLTGYPDRATSPAVLPDGEQRRPTLREQALKGGAYLAGREGFGVALALVATTVITRLIGPTAYGLFVGAFAVMTFLSQVATLGTDVYLVRRQGGSRDTVYHQVFSFLLVSGLVLAALGMLVSPLLVRWMHDDRYLPPLLVLLALLPLNVLPLAAIAQLERALQYRKVAVLDLGTQLTNYAIAVTLAWRGAGLWSLVAGVAGSQIWKGVASLRLARYRPRWYWSSELLHEMLDYGLGYSVSMWIGYTRSLVNPLVVGPILGPTYVGYVALATRMTESLSFVNTAAWRLSIAVLAKVTNDVARLRVALEQAMGLQPLALGPFLAGFAVIAPWLVPVLFGPQWMPALDVYPFLALGALVSGMFSMAASTLYVLQRNWDIAIFNATSLILLAATAFVCMTWWGLWGYCAAQIAGLGAFAVLHRQINSVVALSYRRAVPWLVAFIPPLFAPLVGPQALLILLLPALVVSVTKPAQAQIKDYWTIMREVQGRAQPSDSFQEMSVDT